MTDLAIGVRLKADASGLVGQVREAKAEVVGFGQAAAGAGAQAATMAQGTATAERGVRELAAAEGAAGAAAEAMATDYRQAAAAAAALTTATGRTRLAINDNDGAARRHQAGMRNLGQQFGDFGLQTAATGDPVRAFTQQIGQMGYAASEMGGAVGRVGAFLTGPWGIALTVGTAVLLPLIQSLFETEKAAEAAKTGAYALSDAQNVLGQIFDLTSGKIKKQNELLILNARLTAINLRADALTKAASARQAFDDAGRPSAGSVATGTALALTGMTPLAGQFFSGNSQVRTLARQAREANAMTDEKARTAKFDQILQISQDVDFGKSGVDKAAFQQAVIDSATSRANTAIADLIDKSLDSGKLAEGVRRDATSTKTPKPKSTAAVEEFGRDTKDRIAAILSQFDDTPPAVRAVNGAVRQLDDLMEDLERRKPPGFKALVAEAGAAKTAVQEGLTKPYDDFLQSQEDALRIQQLLTSGHVDEATALRAVLQIERSMGPLGPDREKAVLATVRALQAEERQVERLQRRQSAYLGTVDDIRSIITQTIYEGPQSLTQLPARIFDSFKQLASQDIVERLLGPVFDDLKDQITGAGKLDVAATRMSGAMDKTVGRLDRLATAASNAAAAVSGRTPDIVVTAPRDQSKDLTPQSLFSGAIGGILRKLGIDDDKADKIGKGAGKALLGAFEGQAASGAFSATGIKQSGTGAALGGALGGLLGDGGIFGKLSPITTALGPLGSLLTPALGILGGTLGGLLAPKAKPGGVTVGAVNGEAARTGSSGSDAKLIGASSGLGDAVAAGVNRIAQQLGGTVGSFNVSIGKYKDDLRVNENGKALGGVKNSGAFGFGDDEGAAVAKAISLAIAQGGVQGLSSAVARALQSSTNIDKAISEALKVADIEKLLGGTGGKLTSVFKDFDATAAERVSLARKYGLDLLQIEKINAEERADLLDKTLRSRVGGLQDFLKELRFGDLAEGSAADRRKSLLAEIETAQADAEAGVEGAAELLVNLRRSLVTSTKDAFGTAGPEYAQDRASTVAGIDKVLQIESRRVADAAASMKTQIDTIAFNNDATEANTSQIAINNARIEELTRALEGMSFGGGGIDFALTARA